MKKIGATAVLFLLFTSMVLGQNLSQTVRGAILDEDSKMPLVGAQVIVLGSEPLIGTTTDDNGNFRLENVYIGRISLQLSYLGYEKAIIPNVVVNSGKEVVLNLSMQESAIRMNEAVVTADKNKGEALNDKSNRLI